jgi:chorismate mutase
VLKVWFFLLLFFPLNDCWAQSLSADQAATEIFGLINQRLQSMKDVAMYKARHRLPVEDIGREMLVLEKAKGDAFAVGLQGQSVEDFFRLQIAAAKAIQYRYRAQWLFSDSEQESEQLVRDLKTEVRPQLLALGKQFNRRVQAYLVAGYTFRVEWFSRFLQPVDEPNLEVSQKRALYEALRQIKLQQASISE